MVAEPKVSLFNLVIGLSNAIDLMSPAIVNHHKRVACMALQISTEMGLSSSECFDIVIAALLHDIGAISTREKAAVLNFEYDFEGGDHDRHAKLGFFLLRPLKCISAAAHIVRDHHASWDEGATEDHGVAIGSHIIHLADRVDSLIVRRLEILGQVKGICGKITEQSGKMFSPQVVDAFKSVAARHSFWFDAISPSVHSVLKSGMGTTTVTMSLDDLIILSKIFCQIVDFRSEFSAAHSSGVAATAAVLAHHLHFSERECTMMRIAAYFHDVGKLAIPESILNKPASLTPAEFDLMRSHPYHTSRILTGIGGLDLIHDWAAFHHERMDGRGYPFGHKKEDLSLGSRIMPVTDVFCALAEERPYRNRASRRDAVSTMTEMVAQGNLDPDVFAVFEKNYEEIDIARVCEQTAASSTYRRIIGPA